MLIAIETSTDIGSVALGRGRELIGEVSIGAKARHAEAILPALDFLLRTARLTRADVRGVVVGAGPGSFTGVRVAAATAQGLATGLNVPLHAYSSLAALALESAVPGQVWALLDARRGEVYAACYERMDGDRMRLVSEPRAMHASDVPTGSATPFIGDGARRYADVLGIAPPPPAYPRAAALLRLAAADPEGGRVAHPQQWEPTYLRGSGAERSAAS